MRGRQLDVGLIRVDVGNTPANAGKTCLLALASPSHGKHPRECGEDPAPPPPDITPLETPPRMRGRRNAAQQLKVGLRNTPANAGKTAGDRRLLVHARKHPRECGEDEHELLVDGTIAETPPRMRGRPAKELQVCGVAGNTPANAGKTQL